MPAARAATEAALAQKLCREYPAAIFQVVIFALDQVVAKAQDITAMASGRASGVSTRTPSLKLTDFPRWQVRAHPGPQCRRGSSGSAAEMVRTSPLGARFLSAQGIHRNGKSKLFANESADETASANLTAVFHATEVDQHVTPARQNAFARQQFAEDHAISLQQHVAD